MIISIACGSIRQTGGDAGAFENDCDRILPNLYGLIVWKEMDKYVVAEDELDRAKLKDLGFSTRGEAVSFLKKLWNQERVTCPICGCELELLHKKAKKDDCDWQCRNCNKAFKTLHLLNEINEQLPN